MVNTSKPNAEAAVLGTVTPWLQYRGTKSLKAEPMTRGEYNAYRGWETPANEDPADEGYIVEYDDGGQPNDKRHAGYISWSPKDVFERSYKLIPADAPRVTMEQPAITGCRQLTQDEVDLMNEAKDLAEQCGSLVAKLRTHANSNGRVSDGEMPALDQRWVSMGASDLQVGFMKLIRGIAQPTTF